jgi:hypothetical protein
MNQFAFLHSEWPKEFASCEKEKAAVHADPVLFYALRATHSSTTRT